MKVLNAFGSTAFVAGSDYFALIIFRIVQLSIRYGACSNTPYAYAAYGLMMKVILGNVKAGCRFGQLAKVLVDKRNDRAMIPRVHLVFYGMINHWREPLQTTLGPLLDAYQIGLEVGDIEFSAYAANSHCIQYLHSGQNIGSLIEQEEICLQQLTKNGENMQADLLRPAYQAALNLNGRSIDPVYLNGQVMIEDDVLKKSEELNLPLLKYYMFAHSAFVAYIFREYDLAAEKAMNIKDIEKKFPCVYALGVQAFYCGLSSFALARRKHQNSSRWSKRGRAMIKKFKKWARYAPENNSHKVMLLKAENSALLLRSKKKVEYTKKAYASAILGARENGFVNDEAIANERAALFYQEIGDKRLFLCHILRSKVLYSSWGANAKVESLTKLYPELKGIAP